MVSLSEAEAIEMDGLGATSIKCGFFYWEYQVENNVQCQNRHLFCYKCIMNVVVVIGNIRLKIWYSVKMGIYFVLNV
jgi:hypothetical protein